MSDRLVLAIGETTFPFHSFDEKGRQLVAALEGVAETETTTDRSRLRELEGSRFDVVVDYLTDSTLAADDREGLLSFVRNGGGYVGVHCAADLTSVASTDPGSVVASLAEPVPELRELLGGHFLTHPEESEFAVEPVADHPVTAGVERFRVYDEPYQVTCDDDVTVLARMDHDDLGEFPVAWTKPYGDGRVCYLSLGHTDEALRHDGFRRLFGNAVRWTAAG